MTALPRRFERRGFAIDGASGQFSYQGRRGRLRASGARMLRRLLQFGEASFEQLAADIGSAEACNATVTESISRVREGLAAAGAPVRITSLYGWGYKLEWRE